MCFLPLVGVVGNEAKIKNTKFKNIFYNFFALIIIYFLIFTFLIFLFLFKGSLEGSLAKKALRNFIFHVKN